MSTGTLVTPADLERLLGTVTVLDVRWRLGGPPGREEYRRGHVPGAAYVDLDTALADPPGAGGRHPLPDPARFEAAMRRAGVRPDRPVVVYDAVAATSAARCWWLLRYFGHPEVRVLDGGYPAWVREGRPVETGETEPAPGDFRARPGHLPVLDAPGAARVARAGSLVDARAAERYRGETEPVDPVAGHVPGARNVPTADNLRLGEDSEPVGFKPVAELRRVYHDAGVDLDRPVGVYCGSGVTATHDVLALDLLGVRAALYAGSWSEWITDPDRPVATGADPG